MRTKQPYRSLLFAAGLPALLLASACAEKPHPLALTRIEENRMDVVLLSPPDRGGEPAGEEPKVLTPFSFEPLWNPARTLLAFTRIAVGAESVRVLSLYEPGKNNYFDIATMSPEYWTGYGFAPAWHPTGRALAFKMRSASDSGVFIAIFLRNRTVKLLPDPASQIRDLCWGDSGLFFTVQMGPGAAAPLELRYVELPPPDQIAPDDPVRLAGESRILGPGRQPRFHAGQVYFLRDTERGFDLLRKNPAGGRELTLAADVGPYFEIGPDGTIAYLSDPEKQGRPIRVTLLHPGRGEPEVTAASAYRMRFSPDGKRLLGLWVTAGAPRYFVYDLKTRRATEVAALREGFSAQVLAELVNRPLFDW